MLAHVVDLDAKLGNRVPDLVRSADRVETFAQVLRGGRKRPAEADGCPCDGGSGTEHGQDEKDEKER